MNPEHDQPRVIFQDKKEAHVNYQRITAHIQEAAALSTEMDVGQEEATVIVHPDFPDLPIAFIWMTDIHYGNIGVDYEALNQHLQYAEFIPNMYAVIGGDTIDNFSAAKHPVAQLGDAITPQVQAQAMMERLVQMDRHSKILAIGYGNHEGFTEMAGLDYWQTFMGSIQAPIFSKNGLLHLTVGRETYHIGIFHKFWGRSSINLSNRGKRAMEYGGYPNQEIVLIGDDHQASAELFSKNGSRKLVVDGGTYKTGDATGKKWGLGPAGAPGYTIFLWPNEHKFEVVGDPATAKDMLDGMIYLRSLSSSAK